MNEYIVRLNGDYKDFEKELYNVGNVIYVSHMVKGLIGLETHYSQSELLEMSFINQVEDNHFGSFN